MKTITTIAMVICLAGCLEQPPITTGHEGEQLPSFSLLLSDSLTQLSTDSIETGQPFVMFYFSPDCVYCRAQVRDIIASRDLLDNMRFYMLTEYSLAEVKRFNEEYGIEQYENITVGLDQSESFSKYFTIPSVPYMAIYDKEKRLKRVLIGKTNVQTIKEIAGI